MPLGTYPTPVEKLGSLCRNGSELWIKRDDICHPRYGGNKVRKLSAVLEEARTLGRTRLLTVGSVGSNHVVATAIFGRLAGFAVDAVLVPQPRTPLAIENLRIAVGEGATLLPAPTWPAALATVARRGRTRESYFIMVGGSSVLGTMSYVDAAHELAAQVERGEMPEPDAVVVTLGSGGTAAGLAVGLEAAGLRTQVVAISVAEPPRLVEKLCLTLVHRCEGRLSLPRTSLRIGAKKRLVVEHRYLGPGYARPTPWGDRAIETGREAGIELDATYTAKTFAAALDLLNERKYQRILYWHTLSSAPKAPLLVGAPREDELDPTLRALLR